MRNGAGRLAALPLIWGFVYAIPGGVIELLANVGIKPAFEANVDMWPQTLGLPGVIAGVLFALLVGALRRARTFEGWSLGTLAGLGALAGLAAAAVLTAAGVIPVESAAFGYTTIMGVPAAAASALLFRWRARRKPASASA